MNSSFKTFLREPSDFLSPMLIKELRQGMRGRVFLSSFLLIQVAMLFCAAGGLVAASKAQQDEFQFFSGLFWFIIGIPLILVIPSLGNSALRSEIQSKSLELIYLTRLTPWRIVAGKWAALFAQSLLFVFAVLPYLALRYFLGGIDLLSELIVLFGLLLASAVLTAATVGFSSHGGWLIRGGQSFFLFVLSWMGLVLFFERSLYSHLFPTATSWAQNPLLLATVFAPLLLLLLLEAGVSKITPPAQPRSFQLRTLGVLFLLAATFFELAGSRGMTILFISAPLLVIAVCTVTETPRWIKSVYTPFVRRGRIGRFVGRFFLYPGWPSGVIWTLSMALLYGLLLLYIDNATDLFSLILVLAMLLFPVALTRLISRNAANGFIWFLGIQAVQLLLAIVGSQAYQLGMHAISRMLTIFPTSHALLRSWNALPDPYSETYVMIATAVLIVSLLIILIRAIPLIPQIRKFENAPSETVLSEPARAADA